jgi:hypothetical protein
MRQLPDALEASLPMAIDIMAEEAQAEVSAAMSSAGMVSSAARPPA